MTTNSPEKPSSPGKSDPICIHSTPNSLPPTEWHGTPQSSGRGPIAQELIATEEKLADLWNQGEINSLLHLAGSVDGSYEQWLCDFFHENIKPTDWVLCSHRAHFHWLLHHWNCEFWPDRLGDVTKPTPPMVRAPEELIRSVLRGKSMFLFGPRFIQSAIVAGTCSIAAGIALAIQRRDGTERVWNFIGDGAEDEGHFYEAVRITHGKKLPLTFIIEDNDSSCGVHKSERGSPESWTWPDCVIRHRYVPKFPHAGTGKPMTLKRTTQ